MPVAIVLLAAGTSGSESAGDLRMTEFAPRSGPRGATLFSAVAPETSGIVTENRYDDPRMWAQRYQEFPVGAIGTGVAIDDYDGDGRPDIFVVSKTESCRLFRNLGGWRFEDVTERAGVGDHGADAREWKQGAAFVDVNNDGRPDLYVCRFGAPNRLYVNRGDGTFQEEAARRGLAITDASGMAAFCDYDRDGWLDVYLVTNLLDAAKEPGGRADHLFHNNGDGTFTDVTARAGIEGCGQGHSVTWWDYDGDGWPDLYVANDFSTPDRLYHNRRDGTFREVIDDVVPVMPHHAMGADYGDFDGDGRIDFFVADMARTTHVREQETIADTRARMRVPPSRPGGAAQVMRGALYLATGAGRCREAAWMAGLAATDWTWSVRAEDLDDDGRIDLFVTNGMVRDYDNVDLRARAMAAEDPALRVRIMRGSPPAADRNLAFRNRGDLVFEETGPAWGLDQRAVSFGAAFGDLDGDGDLDLVHANYQAGVTVLRNDEDRGHRLVVALRGTRSNRFGIGAVVRIETAAGSQVRQLGLARGYLSTSEPVVHFGLGDATTIRRLTVEWPSGMVQRFDDLAGDRRLTITEPDARPAPAEAAAAAGPAAQFADVTAELGLSIRARERPDLEPPAGPARASFFRCGPALAVGDVDRDGREDLVVGATTLDAAQYFRRAADGRWAVPSALPLAPDNALDDGPLVIFDADGDGAADLLVTKAGAGKLAGLPDYQPTLLHGDGHGGWRADDDALPGLAFPVGAAVAADFDRDGRADLFIGGRVVPGQYPTPPRSVLLANRGGRWIDVTAAAAPGPGPIGMVTAALACDVDGDGWTDLVIATEWGGVRYWRNRAGAGFEDRSDEAGFSRAGPGWWSALATGDFNGDGRPDFMAGNAGLNTRYVATPAHPALLFRGIFAGDGPPVTIEAHWDGDRIVPWAPRRVLARDVPEIRRKFHRNADYARASLAAIVGADRLQAARRHEATELRSGAFLSRPDGTYRFEPLPRIAQLAPVAAIAVADFDGDGKADVFLGQNRSVGPDENEPASGGLGQLLFGTGDGGFHPVPPDRSGLIVPGDVRAVVAADLDGDGWPDLLVARNDAAAIAFRNRGVPGRAAPLRWRGEPAQDRNSSEPVLISTRAGGR